MSPFLLMQKKKKQTKQKKQTYDTCEGTKKTLKYELYANQVMLLVIRLTMKKNNITKLLQHCNKVNKVINLITVINLIKFSKNQIMPQCPLKSLATSRSSNEKDVSYIQ